MRIKLQYFAFFALRGTSTKELSGIMAAFKISFPLLDVHINARRVY
jgi:hypothetical protein